MRTLPEVKCRKRLVRAVRSTDAPLNGPRSITFTVTRRPW
jgi:hypothetical protein